MFDIRLRLSVHNLLRESQTFPSVELEIPGLITQQVHGYLEGRLSWRVGMCQGDSGTRSDPRTKIGGMRSSLLYQRRTQHTSCQIYHRVSEGDKLDPHLNVLPVVQVSEKLLLSCIMAP